MTRPLLFALLILTACSEEAPTAQPETFDFVAATPEEAKAKALKATGTLLSTLITRLTNELKDKDPHLALAACSEFAQDITRDIRDEQDVDVHRTALRYRNPKNKPDEFERAWMENALAQKKEVNPAGEGVVLTAADGSREYRFVRPLFLAQLCIVCHGPTDGLSDGVKAALAERYPDDRATGFGLGDLRGIVSVRIPLAKQ